MEDRRKKGWGKVTQVMGILGEVALGAHRVEAGLILRSSILVSSLLWSAEAWSAVSDKELKRLEQVDTHFLRLLVGGHSKCPTVFHHLETGTLKLRHILTIQRLLYLRHIVTLNDDETVKKVYEKQKAEANKGDWYKLIKKDFEFIGEDLDEDSVKMKTKNEYKKWVISKVKKAAFDAYIEEKNTLSKIRSLNYTKLETQLYLKDKMFDKEERKLLYAMRSRCHMSKNNFKKMNRNDLKCSFGCDSIETQKHVFGECEPIKHFLKSSTSVQYEGIYEDAESQKHTIKDFLEIDKARQEMMSLLPGEAEARTHASPSAMQQTCL